MKRILIPSLWLIILLGCAWWALVKTPISNDITLFIPKTDPTAELLLEQLQSGPAARLILIGLEGGTEQAKAASSKRLAQQLRETGLFARVANGEELFDKDEQRKLFSYRYLLSPAVSAQRFSPEALRAALQQRLRELGSPVSALERNLLPDDPTGEFMTLLRTWQGSSSQQPDQRFGVWFSPDGERALLLAETHASGYDLDAQERIVATIKERFAAAQEARDVQLLLSGPAVFAVLSQDTIRAEAQVLSTAASLAMVLILLIAYRSLRLVLLSALPLASAILVAVAVVSLLFGGIYGITLAFGVTLLGVAIDYPIHLFSHLNEQETVAQSLLKIWPTVRQGAVTTAIGYFAMITPDFIGLAQLGVFSIAGLLTAALFTRWVLPALLPRVWAPGHCAGLGDWMIPLLSLKRIVAVALVIIGSAVLLVLIVVRPPLWEDDLAALSPIPESVLVLDQQLRTALGAPEAGHLIVINAVDAETALQRSEAVARYLQAQIAAGVLSGFEAASHCLPSLQTQRERQAALPGPETLAAHLASAQAGLSFKAGLFEPFLKAVEAARSEPLLVPHDLSGTALGLRLGSLLFQSKRGWIALVPLTGVSDPQRLAEGLALQAYEGVRYLDMKAETNRLVAGFRDAALIRLGGGIILLAGVLWLEIRSWRRIFLAVLLPVWLAIVIDVAVLLGLGERLSLFHLVSLLLVFGIGIDYGLFFSRSDPELATRQHTLHATLLCGSSTIAVFGMLALSALPVLDAIGQTVALGVFINFFTALAVAQHAASKLSTAAQ